jgi:hypothetical protein
VARAQPSWRSHHDSHRWSREERSLTSSWDSHTIPVVTEKNLPWQPTDQTAWAMRTCLNWGGDLALYAAGFREGAQVLLKTLRESGHGQDGLVYPIVYNLRHAVELTLKQVIRCGRRLVDEAGDFPDGHRLNNLWNTCKPILKQVWPNEEATYRKVETTITALCAIDPEGEGFRYPVSAKKKNGVRSPALDKDLMYLDLDALVADVIEVLDLLDGADSGIDAYLDLKADMLEEHRAIEHEMRAEFEADMRAEYAADARGDY